MSKYWSLKVNVSLLKRRSLIQPYDKNNQILKSLLVLDYKFGVQLRDEENVLINLNLPNGEIRLKFMDWLHESIEETKELLTYLT